MTKKVLFISPTGTFDNGAEISIFYLMKLLVEQGYEVHNVAPQTHAAIQTEYYDKYEKLGIHVHFIPVLKWWWEDAPGGLPGSIEDRGVFYRENISRIRQLIQEEEVSYVISNTVNVFQGAVAAACESVPHYWLIHEFPSDEFAYYRKKIDFIAEYSDEIYCVTGNLHLALQELFPKRQVKKFISFTELKPVKLKIGQKNRIVSIGRITKRKNQLELIKAYKNLDRPEIELVFIGAWDKDYKNICSQYIHDNNLLNVTFIGNKKNPWEELTDQDICVYSSAMETFGLVYVEALLNGIPVILSDNPGHQSAYEIFEFGTMYSLGDIEELTKKMKQLIDNFSEEKYLAMKQVATVQKKYQASIAYKNIVDDLRKNTIVEPKAVRHLASILSTNEQKTLLNRTETKIRRIVSKIKTRLF
ncbi:glycosyltransferase family 4 protein [Enterococcus sp. AZ109]|uniref:glycosyltransferase family 4 protein n=1 Tax=Enterococcus sp. AZ109 TaxID=2774634 RepID=UPI003F26A7A2